MLTSARGNVIQRRDHVQSSNHDSCNAKYVPAAERSGDDRAEIPAVGTAVPPCDNCPGGPVVARAHDGRPYRRPSAVEETMPERQKPIVTELALADALDRLVQLISELRADANLRVEITTDETDLVKLVFAGAPGAGFPLRREARDFPAEIVRRVWNEGLRDYEIV